MGDETPHRKKKYLMTYVFIGPPASGKGTQAKLLAQKLKGRFYSIGALLRKRAENDPALSETINNGRFASLTIVRELLNTLAKQDHGKNMVIDGSVRSPAQARDILKYWPHDDLRFILLDIPDEEIIRRASHRLENNQPRQDDKISVVKRRIKAYRHSLKPILAILQNSNIKIIFIEGIGSVDAIHRKIVKLVHD